MTPKKFFKEAFLSTQLSYLYFTLAVSTILQLSFSKVAILRLLKERLANIEHINDLKIKLCQLMLWRNSPMKLQIILNLHSNSPLFEVGKSMRQFLRHNLYSSRLYLQVQDCYCCNFFIAAFQYLMKQTDRGNTEGSNYPLLPPLQYQT